MRTIICDGCGIQLVSSKQHTFVVFTKSKWGSYNNTKLESDLCNDCFQYIQMVSYKALKDLQTNPEKWKKII